MATTGKKEVGEKDVGKSSSKKTRRSVGRSVSWRLNKKTKMEDENEQVFGHSVEVEAEASFRERESPHVMSEDEYDEFSEPDGAGSSSKKRKRFGVWRAMKRMFRWRSSKGSKSFTAGDGNSPRSPPQRSISDPNLICSADKPELAPLEQVDETLSPIEPRTSSPKKAMSHDSLMSELRSKQRKSFGNDKETSPKRPPKPAITVSKSKAIDWQVSASSPTPQGLVPGLNVSHDKIRVAPRHRRAPTRKGMASVRNTTPKAADVLIIPRSKSVGCSPIHSVTKQSERTDFSELMESLGLASGKKTAFEEKQYGVDVVVNGQSSDKQPLDNNVHKIELVLREEKNDEKTKRVEIDVTEIRDIVSRKEQGSKEEVKPLGLTVDERLRETYVPGSVGAVLESETEKTPEESPSTTESTSFPATKPDESINVDESPAPLPDPVASNEPTTVVERHPVIVLTDAADHQPEAEPPGREGMTVAVATLDADGEGAVGVNSETEPSSPSVSINKSVHDETNKLSAGADIEVDRASRTESPPAETNDVRVTLDEMKTDPDVPDVEITKPAIDADDVLAAKVKTDALSAGHVEPSPPPSAETVSETEEVAESTEDLVTTTTQENLVPAPEVDHFEISEEEISAKEKSSEHTSLPVEVTNVQDPQHKEDSSEQAPVTSSRSKRLTIEMPEKVFQKPIMNELRKEEIKDKDESEEARGIQRRRPQSTRATVATREEGQQSQDDSNAGVAKLTQVFERSTRCHTISYSERRKKPDVLPKPKISGAKSDESHALDDQKSRSLGRNYRFPVSAKKPVVLSQEIKEQKEGEKRAETALKPEAAPLERKTEKNEEKGGRPKPLPKPKIKKEAKPEVQSVPKPIRNGSARLSESESGNGKSNSAVEENKDGVSEVAMPSFWARRNKFTANPLEEKANGNVNSPRSPEKGKIKEAPKHAPYIQLKTDTCAVCGAKVYQTERFKVKDNVVHRGCIKCSVCKRLLSVGNFIMSQNKIYCKPHEPSIITVAI